MENNNSVTNNDFLRDLIILGYLVKCVDKEGLYKNGDRAFCDSILHANEVLVGPMITMLLSKFLTEHEFVEDYNEEKKNLTAYFGVKQIGVSRVLEFLKLETFNKEGNEQIPDLDIKLKLLKAVAADNEKWYSKTYKQLKKEPEVLNLEDNEDILAIQSEIEATKIKFEKVKADLGADDPIVATLEERIRGLEDKKQSMMEELSKNLVSPAKKELADKKERYEKVKAALGEDDPIVVNLAKEIETLEQSLKEDKKQDKPKRLRIKAKVKRNVSSKSFKEKIKDGIKWLGSKIREWASNVKNFFNPEDDYYDEDYDDEEVEKSEKPEDTSNDFAAELLAEYDKESKGKGRSR